LCLSLAVLTLSPGTSASAELYDESFALVVGIDRYRASTWPTLGFAVKDAKAVASLLSTRGFTVTELYDGAATKDAILSAMQNGIARRVGERDRVLVFFAGHGFTESLAGQDWGYIVPHDAGPNSATYISMEELRAQSAKMGGATHQLFIMDSCYGGTLGTRGAAALSPQIPGYLEEVTRRVARQMITAGGKGQEVADGGPRGHSVFTGYLLEALDDGLADLNGDGYVTFSELSAYLVPRATSEVQTPAVDYLPGHGSGEFVFNTATAAPKGPGTTTAAPSQTGDNYAGYTGRQAAEKLVSDWLRAHLHRDLDTLLGLAEFPFYFDNEILVGPEDLASAFRRLFSEKPVPSDPRLQIQSIRVQTIGELTAEGYDASRDRVLPNLHLADTDFAIRVRVSERGGSESVLFFARRTPSGLRMVGTWD
jgi:hypothetical protein